MIRKADKNDIEKIAELRVIQQKEVWEEEYEDKYDLYNSTKAFLQKHLNKDVYIFIEDIEGAIAAICAIQIFETMQECVENGIEGRICNVYTIPEYRKQGLQENLLRECMRFAETKNVKELNLKTSIENAIKLYEKLEFQKDRYTYSKYI